MNDADAELARWLSNGEMAQHNAAQQMGRTEPKPQRHPALTARTIEEVDARPRVMPVYQKIVLMGERPKSWNVLKRFHWSKWQKEVERCKVLIIESIGRPDMIRQPVNLVFTPFYKGRPLDTSNFPEKLYEDGLVASGLLADDNRKYVWDITKKRPQIDKKRPRVEIEIIGAQ